MCTGDESEWLECSELCRVELAGVEGHAELKAVCAVQEFVRSVGFVQFVL